ncbi:MAG: diguanylate cyclase [Sphaerochaeta sp.]|nr:diguanylate cyclase [Sphaerochaeta sp.]
MDHERSTEARLILSFIAFSCIIIFVAIISLVSINRTTADLQGELGRFTDLPSDTLEQSNRILETDTLASSITVISGSLVLILINFLMTFGGLNFTRKEKRNRDRTEEELRAINDKLSSVIEGTNVGTWVLDIPTGISEINARWAEIVGYTLEELSPFSIHTWRNLTHPDDLKVAEARMQEVLAGKQDFYEVEFRMHHKTGTWVWVLDRGKVTKWSALGEPLVMSGTHTNITRFKQAQAALEKSEGSHRKLVEQMNQGLLVCRVEEDTDHRMVDAIVLSVNKRFEEIIEKSAEDILGTSVDSIFRGSRTEWIELFKSVVDSGKPKIAERYTPNLGKHLRISAYSPEPLLFAAIIDDITQSKVVQNQFALEKARLETTLLSVGDGVIALGRTGHIDVINSVAQNLTGWDYADAVGKFYREVLNFGEEDIVENSIEAKKSVEAGTTEVLVSKQGESIPIEAIASPIFDASGNVDGVVLVFRDCTEKRNKQERILHFSYSDPMTGLKNRRAFEEEVHRLNHVRYCPLVLVIADVNNLKLTNDAFGHDAGDTLLRTVAEILRKECRETDIVARIGGDEFVILLPNTDAEHANVIIDRINASIATARVKDMPVSVSFGKSVKLVRSNNMDELFREAEHEMYRKKVAERPQIRKRIIDQLLSSLFSQNPEEQVHSERVGRLCRMIAEHAGLGDDEVDEMQLAGVMHDIGKVALGSEFLATESLVDELEGSTVLRHPEVGYNILSATSQYGAIAEFVLAHHERWDGTGYPSGLKGPAIPLQGRILALADSYSLMTTAEPNGLGLSDREALGKISMEAGSKYDPELTTLLTQLVLGND